MATGGVLGNGTKVAFSESSPLVITRIGQLLDVGLSSLTREKVDRTIHSTSPYKRSMPGMIEVTDLTITILADFDETTTGVLKTLRDHFIAGTTLWFIEEVPTSRAQTKFQRTEYQGYIVAYTREAPIEGRQAVTITIAFDSDTYNTYPAGASVIG